ncbi:MAG: hypothetical protein LBV79_06875 [Candidatus Adiutrix sp.]|jgi:hypothetical protein|nr:hypothetical protein [Candidatus Adiutrix sp.]
MENNSEKSFQNVVPQESNAITTTQRKNILILAFTFGLSLCMFAVQYFYYIPLLSTLLATAALVAMVLAINLLWLGKSQIGGFGMTISAITLLVPFILFLAVDVLRFALPALASVFALCLGKKRVGSVGMVIAVVVFIIPALMTLLFLWWGSGASTPHM